MPATHQISPRARNVIIIGLSLIFVSIAAHTLTSTQRLIGRPFQGFLLLENNFVNIIYLPEWEGFKSGIKIGDVVKAVDGVEVKNADQVREIVFSKKPGQVLTYTVLRRGQTLDLAVKVTEFTFRDWFIPSLVWMFSGLAFFLLGLVVFFFRPNLGAARAMLFFGIVNGFAMMPNPGFFMDNSNFLPLIFLTCLGPSVTVLGLYFPVKLKWRKPVVAALAVVTAPIIFFYVYFLDDLDRYLVVDKIFFAHLVATFSLGVGLMARSFLISKDPVVRQKAKVVVTGFIITTVFGGLGLIAALTFKRLNFFWLFIPFLVSLAGLGYAVVKQNIFDADAMIRRSASYTAVTVVMVVTSIVLLSGLSFLLHRVGGQSSEVALVATIAIMVIVFNPLKQKIDTVIERRFFGKRYKFEETIRKAGVILNSIIELDDLQNQMLDTVMQALQSQRGMILFPGREEGEAYLPYATRDYSDGFSGDTDEGVGDDDGAIRIGLDHPLVRWLENREKAVHLADLELEKKLTDDREEILELMSKLKVVLFVPILYEYRLIGMLGLGGKITGAMYSSEDVDLLQTLMIQTAVSIENARKVEDLKKMVELETSYRHLKEVDEMKDNFLSMVSHDLRTPMTGIKAYAAILKDGLGSLDQATQKKYLDIIIQQGDRLTRLITDLLDIQRFESGKMELEMADLNLGDLVTESLDAFMGVAYEKGLKMEKELCGEEAVVSGHRDRLHQVMANLLSNAVKFTPEHGTIRVRMEIRTRSENRAVQVSVVDTGPGVEPELQDKLFEKYQQVHRLVRDRDQGSGLGLALVRQIIEYHDGRVGMQSKPGEGSCFYFLLPLREAKARTQPAGEVRR